MPAAPRSSRASSRDPRHTPPRDASVEAALGDDELARRARLGDHDAFGLLVDRHGAAMYRFARRMLRDDAQTEDVVQDALVTAWTSLDRFRGEAAVRTWMFGILAYTVRRAIRTRSRQAAQELDADQAAPAERTPEHEAMARDLLDALERALADLPPMQRACWILAEVERMSYADIARVQSTTVPTVRGALHRARQSLERRLAPWR